MVTSLEAAAWVLAVVAGAVPELRDPAHRFGATYGELRQAVLDPHRHLGERLSVLERRDGGALGGDGVPG
jgi:hypothetical protein